MPIADTGNIRRIETSLHFQDPQQIDSGNYTFIVNNTAGEKTKNVWIIVSGMLSQKIAVALFHNLLDSAKHFPFYIKYGWVEYGTGTC